jgi:hypothetical protein
MGVLREQTKQYIEQNPKEIVLTRYVKVADGAGGTRTNSSVLPSQTMRAITNRSAVSAERRTVGGVTVVPEVTLQGLWTADIRRGDTFMLDGVLMEVVWVSDLGYEKLAEVTTR